MKNQSLKREKINIMIERQNQYDSILCKVNISKTDVKVNLDICTGIFQIVEVVHFNSESNV